jgi:DNA-binding CsgD family transcriptional regulator
VSRAEGDLLAVLDTLYEGLLDEDAWQRGLVDTANLVRGSGVMLFSLNPSTGQVFRADVTRLDPAVALSYNQTWIHQDARHAAGLTCPVGEPQIDGMLVSNREYHRSAVFNELLLPADCPYHLATWIERRPERGVVLSIQGTWKRGPFDEDTRDAIQRLIPHFRRLVAVKDRLLRSEVTASALLDTMERLPFGMLLLGVSLEILEASGPVRQLLAKRDGLHADHGCLGFVRHGDGDAFARRLREDRTRATAADAIVIERPHPRPALSLLVLPLKPGHEPWLRPAARWMVLVFDPECTPALPTQRIQSALGITCAEALLAQLLAKGCPLARAADHLGLSLHTVRSQLKSIYAKTGLNSQAQLVRFILTSAALVGTLPES